jgi:mannose-6-phosphate isomerase-like protein (cupin superfamily)
MQIHSLSDLADQTRSGDANFNEFLREGTMSAGLYLLKAGGIDDQVPHREDEIYVVNRGHGRIRVGNEDHEVGPGSVVFVPALVEHRFHDFTEDLEILVIFAPPYTGRG